MKKAVCLLSGGLDSTTALYWTKSQGCDVSALTIHYGQLHECEIEAAKTICRGLEIPHQIISVPMPWGGSALLDKDIPIPIDRDAAQMGQDIPATYVPARNTVFLSLAASYSEAIGAEVIVIGANALDYSGYPDCRPEYFESFTETLKRGTRSGAEGRPIQIEAPLLRMTKKEIVLLAQSLKVPLEKTWSCYLGKERPCGVCDSCRLRQKGFGGAGLEDPQISDVSARILS
ncbi:MAG: 7-cyano-7-deazaguanine synthase QueC [Candidatus Omnitrophica bacterium]|nr:7-cyano-7-deazaguanine synthase QueC [Candidatus Omnitrophota bacterium]